jgi:hypothetical protein
MTDKADHVAWAADAIAVFQRHCGTGDEHAIAGRQDVRARIAYLSRDDEEALRSKRRRIEELLWLIHEHNAAELWESIEVLSLDKKGRQMFDCDAQPIMRKVVLPKPLNELPKDLQRCIESIAVNDVGIAIPKTFSKLQASAALCRLLGVGPTKRGDGELSRLSDSELVAELAWQANELGDVALPYRGGPA